MMLAMVDRSSGAASASATEAGDDLGRGGEYERPPDDGVHGVQPVTQSCRDTEVAAATADRPEQIRVRLGIGAADLAVGGDHLRGQHAVDRQPVPADQESHPSAEGDAADTD
jgi:hypothetical protein